MATPKQGRALPPADDRPHVHVLGLDPGMRCVGWAIFRLYRDGKLDFVIGGTFGTEKADKKSKTLSTDDNFRRAREIARHLLKITREFDVKAIAAEGMSFPRSSSVAAKMAMCWGVLAMLAELLDPLPVLQASPQQLKKACGVMPLPRQPKVDPGDKAAKKIADRARRAMKAQSKSDVQEAMSRMFPALSDVLDNVPKDEREHPADACAAVVCALPTDEFRTLRAMLPA